MELLLPFVLLIFASFFQGSFGLGMKYMSPLSWEAWWLIHVTIAMIIFPFLWAIIVVPNLFDIISSSPVESIQMAMLYGFLWGIGGIMFGVSVPYIGLSLTMGIVMGLAGSVGSLIPFFQGSNSTSDPVFSYVLGGLLISLVGVALTAKAGIDRDKLQNSNDSNNKSNIIKGILIAVVCGVLSALLNVGFSNAAPIAKTAEDFGVITRNSSLVAWVVVLWGAFLMNALYCVYLLFKNNSWNSFNPINSFKAYRWSVIAGLCWFAALGVYGQGAALLGDIGPVIGWPILLGLSLIISNFWAYRAGEWKNAKKPFNLLLIGLIVLIFSAIVLGLGSTV
ncbi:MAG: rhamnose/proton symporter RhaT [Cryomorphaceae bacterium]|nr:MAG: rhamnose/proton symporter RhaT [Cryomorphaceae bacterium]|tara:strand:+ start:6179 stop:7186 length:1008 start_codon:yes stop_codon:yes gene_type:complete